MYTISIDEIVRVISKMSDRIMELERRIKELEAIQWNANPQE